jgi:predicted small lipoprotein YifL
MNFFVKLMVVLFISFVTGCGKKSYLDKYPGSDYPRQYPSQNEE